MKKTYFLAVLFFFIAFSVFAAPLKIIFKNSTGYEIVEIYISPSNSDDWGDDYLAGASLNDGRSFTVTLNPSAGEKNLYDVQLVDIEGYTYSQYDIPVKNDTIIEFTSDDLDK